MDIARTPDVPVTCPALAQMGEPRGPAGYPAERPSNCFWHGTAAVPSAVSQARRLTKTVLTEWRFSEGDVEAAELVMSELATNAVNAAPGQPFGIRLWVRDGRPLLAVWDSSDQDPQEQEPDADSERGRGLLIVAALAKEWGRRSDTYGKLVWASL